MTRTFLIADVRGYTRFTREHGDAAAARLAKTFADLAREAVEARNGEVIELRGDEALAVFSSPEQAIRAASEFQATCAEEFAKDDTVPLLVGIGIDSGEAVRVEDGFRGVALNMAARLCSNAAAGQVLVTRGVAGAADGIGSIRLETRGAASLKGFEYPVELVEVVRDEQPISPPEVPGGAEVPVELDSLTPLIDREHATRWLRGTWRQVRRGRGRLLFVSGPTQIGKTRLAAELAAYVSDTGRIRYAGPGGAATAIALTAVEEAAGCREPTLFVLDDIDVTGEAVPRALDEALEAIESGPSMVLGLLQDTNASAALADVIERSNQRGDGHRVLPSLGPEGVREIARLYAGDDTDDVPMESVVRSSGGVPGRVHELVSEWARDEASRRLGAAADWLATGRDRRSADLAFANNVIGLKLGRLFSVEPGNDSAGSASCPYKGLASFEERDAAFFFGREHLVGELAARTVQVGLLGVVGASGSGKSSVVSAGLLPSLRARLLPGSDRWQHVSIRPGEHPMAELGAAIAGWIPDGHVDDPLGMAAEAVRPESRLVVVVDQFEEVFTTCTDEGERGAFIAALTGPAARRPDRIVVVVCLRGDFYGHCASYPDLAEQLAANHVLVGPMTQDELRRSIVLPARRAGLRVESGLIERLIEDVAEEPGGLPLLSTTLVELWQSRADGWLRLDEYERGGGVQGSVARLAERTFENLNEQQQAIARAIFLRLVGPGEGDAITRRRAPLSEFDLDTDEVTSAVLRRLTQDRLLTMGDSTVEVAHEALLREWPRVRGWLEEDAQGRQLRQHLTAAARRWEESDREPSELYRGARLSVALDWTAPRGHELNELEREFLSRSRQASELEAERQRRTNRRLRGLLTGVAVFLVLALLAGGVALVQRGRARESAAKAGQQADIARSRELASSAISVLDEDPELTILLANEAKRAAPGEDLPPRLVTALHEAVRSMRTLMSRGWDRSLPFMQLDGVMSPDASLVVVTGRKETLQAWDSATGDLVWEIKDKNRGGWFSHPQFSPDGSVLAVAFNRYWTKQNRVEGGRATGIYLIDPRNGELLDRIPPSSKCGWVGLPSGSAFTPNGAQLILVADPPPCRDGGMRLEFVGLNSGSVTRRVPVTSSPQVENEGPHSVLFVGVDARHGRLQISDGVDVFGLSAASTRMIDLASRKVLWERPYVNGFLSPDGSIMALSAPDPTQRAVELVDPATGETLRYLTGQKAGTADVAFSHDGRLAYTAGLDGTARVWDTATGSNLITLTGQKHGLVGLSVDDKGDRLATFGLDGTARVWDLTTKPLGETMALDLSPRQIGTRAIDAAGGVGAVMALANRDTAVVFDLATGEIIRRFPDHAGLGVALAPDGRAIIYQHVVGRGPNPSTLDVGPIVVRDVATGATRTEFEGLCSYGLVDVDPSKDCPVLPPNHPYAEFVLGMSVTPDGRYAVAGGQSVAASVWDLDTGSVVATLGPFGEPGSAVAVSSAAISPDGSKVAVRIIGDQQPRVIVLGLDRSVLAEFPLEPPATSAGHIAFSPDGSLLAAGGSQLKVFDTKSWTVLWQVDAHDGGVFDLDFSPDGRSIVTTGFDGFVRLWDARDGSLLQAISMGEDFGKAVAFTDDRHLIVGTQNGLVAGLTFDVDELLRIGRSRVTRTLTDQECRTYLHLDTCP
ncbi:MAG: PQQ-binding-like beta-propeller repeat protein [Actinomycetota bacterium]|nr:PQQ-binding-like beta-propeller repeat protein [Actinomycetota bacterium]